MSKTATIRWGAFSEKHRRYIHNAKDARMAVAEGAIRSGKTIDHCILAAMYLELTPDKYHLATGSTIGNAKLNIGVCNGFGLENLFRGRCKWGKCRDNEALFLYTQTGEKVVVFAGGGKADSYKRILGNSYGLWIATEINEHFDSNDSRESFVKVSLGRQAAATKPYTLWDLNPSSPSHSVYREYIDRYRETFVGKYVYEHFTMHDNATITPDRIAELESQYTVGTIWYRRDILGERCVALGRVYQAFEDCLVDAIPYAPVQYAVSLDYGTLNATAMILWGMCGTSWYAIREAYHSGRDEHHQLTDDEYMDMLLTLMRDVSVSRIIIDPSAASFITLVRKRGWHVDKADNDVLDGIRDTATALQRGLVKVLRSACPHLCEEMSGYLWDAKATTDRPLKVNDHMPDAARYFVRTMKLVRRNS
jgi:PBSX family phage terminase large subunit